MQTQRTINGVSFDGSGDITITAVCPQTLTLATSGIGISGSATYNGGTQTTFTVTSNATSQNTQSTIVARDQSGNFSQGTITQSLSGNQSTQTKWQTGRTLTIGNTGKSVNGESDVSWSLSEIGAQPQQGSTSITTLGTVTTGTWNAGQIQTSSQLTVQGTTTLNGPLYMNKNQYWAPNIQNWKLVQSANDQEWSFDLKNQNTYTGGYWNVWSDKTGIGTILIVRGDTGFVGIRNVYPQYTLDVTGDIRATGTIYGSKVYG